MFKFPALESLQLANTSSAFAGAPISSPFHAAPVYINTTPAAQAQSRNNTMLILAAAGIVAVLIAKGKI